MPERPSLPAPVQGVEALRHAVVGRRDLVGVDRVELLSEDLGVPEDQRLATDQTRTGRSGGRLVTRRDAVEGDAGEELRGANGRHTTIVLATRASHGRSEMPGSCARAAGRP